METSRESSASMTKNELRTLILLELKRTGITSSITSKMREEMAKALHLNSFSFKKEKQLSRNAISIEQMALRSLVLEYLDLDGLDSTKCVFVSESGLEECILTTEDALKAYGIRIGSEAYRYVGTSSRNETFPPSIGTHASTFHKLLYHFSEQFELTHISKDNVSTQTETTKSHSLQARLELDRQLTQIEQKFKHVDKVSRTPTRRIPEAKIFSYQKQSEENVKKVMLQKLEDFKIKEIAQMRLEEAQKREKDIKQIRSEEEVKYNLKLEHMNNKEDIIKKDYDLKHKELTLVYKQSKQALLKEVEELKRREKEMQRKIEVDNERLQLKNEKMKHLLAVAEAKLKLSEEKESEVMVNIDLEYEKVHAAARKSYHAASEVLGKQSELYTKELMELSCEYTRDIYMFDGRNSD